MKKFLVIILLLCLFFTTGFKRKEKPFVLLSSAYITNDTFKYFERNFFIGQKVYYAVVAPEYFKDNSVRVQVSFQNEKTSNWGYEIIETNDIFIDKAQKIYRNYVVPRKKGHYILQFFYIDNKRYPFAHVEFMVR